MTTEQNTVQATDKVEVVVIGFNCGYDRLIVSRANFDRDGGIAGLGKDMGFESSDVAYQNTETWTVEQLEALPSWEG